MGSRVRRMIPIFGGEPKSGLFSPNFNVRNEPLCFRTRIRTTRRCLSDCLTTARIFAGMEVVWCHFLDLNSAGRNSLSSASRLLPAFKRFWRGIPRLPLDFWYERRLYYLRADCYRQWDEAKDHLGTLREVSIAVNGTTGKVLHEIVTDGLIFFGTVAQPATLKKPLNSPRRSLRSGDGPATQCLVHRFGSSFAERSSTQRNAQQRPESRILTG
jgi:hypothetical protein